MSISFRPVIGVVSPHPEEQTAPAATCDQCTYYHPLFDDSLHGECVHAWSDHAGDLVISLQSCPLVTNDYDPTLDITKEQSWSVRR